jgi:hypothetical protein
MPKCAVLGPISCVLAVGFLVVGMRAAPVAAADPFQRSITIRNDLPIAVYPVISTVENEQYNCGTTAVLRRIIVNAGKRGVGIPSGRTVAVNIPKKPSCWYKAVRLYLFGVNLDGYESRINPKERTVADGGRYNPPLCPANACWTGTAQSAYQIDSPAQLTEFTIDSLNPNNSRPFANPNNTAGIPLVDLDLSFVDSVYLPVAMGLADGGLTQYMGTAQGYNLFNKRTARFLTLKDALNRPVWSEFAAYSAINWPNNIFNDLGSKRTDQVEGGYNLVHNVGTNAQSPLYTPTYSGPAACSNPANAICKKAGLVGMCCPAQSGNFLTCCSIQPYLIANTTKTRATVANPVGIASNRSVTALVQRWTLWVNSNPCSDLGKIGDWPSPKSAFNKPAFCSTFRNTVRYVWNYFATNATECKSLTGFARNLCIADNIIGYKSKVLGGRLPESVQALQRSVPWGNPNNGQLQYSFDKFLLNWAPYNSAFNLNPYVRFIHNSDDGLDAPGAYGFSIDDRYGNFQSRASGFIVDVGGKAAMLNKEPYDPYHEYDVAFAQGWDHATACGRKVPIPGAKPGNAPIAFWLNGQRRPGCVVVLYTTAAGNQYAKYRVTETTKSVTDTYTGLQQTISELALDRSYCRQNSTPALVDKAVCINSNVSANQSGDLDFVSLSKANKPKVHLNLPANPL